MKIPLFILQAFMKQLKKDHGGKCGIENFENIEISTNKNSVSFDGSYDCPPIYFHYRYAADTDWQLRKVDNKGLIVVDLEKAI